MMIAQRCTKSEDVKLHSETSFKLFECSCRSRYMCHVDIVDIISYVDRWTWIHRYLLASKEAPLVVVGNVSYGSCNQFLWFTTWPWLLSTSFFVLTVGNIWVTNTWAVSEASKRGAWPFTIGRYWRSSIFPSTMLPMFHNWNGWIFRCSAFRTDWGGNVPWWVHGGLGHSRKSFIQVFLE